MIKKIQQLFRQSAFKFVKNILYFELMKEYNTYRYIYKTEI